MDTKQDEKTLASEIGMRLREIRELLGRTLKEMQQLTGVSLSYISDFERGKKMPSSKYLKALALEFDISLDYVVKGYGHMSMSENIEQSEIADFGKYSEDVVDLLTHMKKVPSTLFAMLSYFNTYKMEQQAFLEKFMDQHSNNLGQTNLGHETQKEEKNISRFKQGD
ncbi:MAG: helix-turn-helix domain-containing protein [bacterium]|nr:helix-turn-helix domain-containing protein [bacterium]